MIWRNAKLKKDGEGRVKWIDRYDVTEKKPLRIFAQRLKFQKTVHPPLKGRAEAETPQVTPSKLPHGTRTNPLSAAISLS